MNIFESLKCSCQVCIQNANHQSEAIHKELQDIIQHHKPLYDPPPTDIFHSFHRVFLNFHLKPPRLLAAIFKPGSIAIAHINSLNRSVGSTEFCSDIGHTLYITNHPDGTVTYERFANVPRPRRYSLNHIIPPVHDAFSISTREYETTRIWDITDILSQRQIVRKFIADHNNPYTRFYYLPTQVLANILNYLYDNTEFCVREINASLI